MDIVKLITSLKGGNVIQGTGKRTALDSFNRVYLSKLGYAAIAGMALYTAVSFAYNLWDVRSENQRRPSNNNRYNNK